MSLSYKALASLASAWRGNESEALDRVGEMLRSETGSRVLTMTTVDMAKPHPLVRIWSSLPDMYPAGQTKSFGNNSDEWYNRVVVHQMPAVFARPEDMARMLPNDYETLMMFGCGTGMNIPVVVRGAIVGLVNLFGGADWVSAAIQERMQALTVLTHAAFLVRPPPR